MSILSQDVFPPTDTRDTPVRASLRERLGKGLLARLNAQRRLGAPVQRVPDNLHRSARQLALGLELLEDFRTGRYKAIAWGPLAVLTGAVLYSISPGEVLPDTLAGLGSLDEAVVLALATRLVRSELQAYCEFKGYGWRDYFPAAAAGEGGARPMVPADVPA